MVKEYKIFIISFLVLGLTAFAAVHTRGDQGDLIKPLNTGGHILMIRHAYAPGFGDPSHFEIGDCTTQRNLDHRGRTQARAIGDWLRSKGIKTAKVYSSQWCRCLETAALLKFGPVTELPALNSFFELPQNRGPNIRALRAFIGNLDTNGDLIILVTHHVTILEITGQSVSSGEGVVLRLKEGTGYNVLGRLSFGL
jgi:phosphohistidine phosphatase SixA